MHKVKFGAGQQKFGDGVSNDDDAPSLKLFQPAAVTKSTHEFVEKGFTFYQSELNAV